MIKPSSHFLSRLGLTAAISLAVLGGLLALRLFQGPVSLGIVTPFIERAMDETLEDFSAHINDTVLRWSREEGRVDLRFVGVTLRDRAQRAVLSIPEMEIGFSVKALTRGVFAPSEVQLIGPSATIMRDLQGRIQLGFQAPGDDTFDDEANELLRKILTDLRSAKADNRLGYLERLYIRDAGLTLYDSITRSIWRAPHSLIALTRTAQDVTLRLDTKVEAGAGAFDLAAESQLGAGQSDIETAVHLNGLRLSKLALGTNGLEAFSGIDVPVHGDATVAIALDGTIKRATFWLFANAGRIVVPGLPSVALDLKAAEAKGTFDATRDELRLERLAYDAGRNRGFVVGNAQLVRSPQGAIAGIAFDLDAEGIALDMPELFSRRGKIDHAAFRGGLDLVSNRLTVDEASIKMGDMALKLAGTIDDRPEGLGADVSGSIEHLPVKDFAALWPIGPARGARDWITENIHAGEITRGAVRILAAPGEFAITPIPDKVIDLSFEFADLTVTYIRGLTPLTEARGHARLTGNRFELELTKGKIGTLDAANGHFRCDDLETHGAPGAIDVDLAGDMSSLLTVLDMQPLGYPSKFGIEPQSVGGTVAGNLTIVVPMRRSVQFADVNLKVDAKTDALTLPAIYRDFAVTDGRLAFAVTNDALEAKGDVALGGYPATLDWREDFRERTDAAHPTRIVLDVTLDGPGRTRAIRPLDAYIEGPTPLRLVVEGSGQNVKRLSLDSDLTPAKMAIPAFEWTKPAGLEARVRFAVDFPADGTHELQNIVLEGPDLSIKGSAGFDAQGALRRLAFDPLKAGAKTDAQLKMTRAPLEGGGSALDVTLKGRAFLAGHLIKGYKDGLDKEKDAAASAEKAAPDSQRIVADLGELTLADNVVLKGFSGSFDRREKTLRDMTGAGTFASGAPLKMSLTPRDDGARELAIESGDGGALLRGLDLSQNIEGGSLALRVKLAPLDANGQAVAGTPRTGTLTMANVRLVKAPILTKVLSVGSFGGIRDMLNGEGLLFETVELPFRIDGKTIVVGSGRAYGPSVGLTIEGHVPRGDGDYDMSGTLVPAYTLNTLLGYVPVLGKILTSRDGEGVVGLTYQVRGDAADPHVLVNPLSALTPGFLRRIFQFGDNVKDMPAPQ